MSKTYLFLIIALLVLVAIEWPVMINLIGCDERIEETVQNIIVNETDKVKRVEMVSKWVSENIDWSTGLCKKRFNDCETLTKRCGACGEKADLFSSMLRFLDIEAYSVVTRGEDHTWNHVILDGTAVFIDVSGSRAVNFNMSLKDFENVYKRNLSVVFLQYENGTEIEITERYTKTGTLNIFVVDNEGEPLRDTYIEINSHSLMEMNPPIRKTPEKTTGCVTDSHGFCNATLGDGTYTIAASKYILFSEKEGNVTLIDEDKAVKIDFGYNPNDAFAILVLVILTLESVWIIFYPIFMNALMSIFRKITRVSRSRFSIFSKKQ